jgi:hypothetical protein
MNKEKKENNLGEEVVTDIVPQNNQIVNVENLIAQAIAQKLPVETMERFFALAKEMQTIRAKSLFNESMAKFQAECPTIVKDKEVKNDSGKVIYKYAPIDSIVKQVKEILQKYGFSYSTSMEVLPNGVKVCVKTTHTAGHSEESCMQVPLGTQTKVMSASQQVAAAQTFAKRYAFLNAFGIMTGDEDNDGANLETNETVTKSNTFPLSDKQMETIKKNMDEKGITEAYLIDQGFPPLKDLTGGKEGTASELIGYLFKVSKFSNGLSEPSEEDTIQHMYIKDLEDCTTVDMYNKVCGEIKMANDNGKLSDSTYQIILKVAKVTAQRIQDSINNLETKPKSEAALRMEAGMAKAKAFKSN